MPQSFESLQLLTEPDIWAARQEEIQRQQMRVYRDKFENNMFMTFHDLWEYVERRLADKDGATVIVHPNDPKQHASAPKLGVPNHCGATMQPYAYVKQANELD